MATAVDFRFATRNAVLPLAKYLLKPVRLVRGYERANLRPDFVAGLTVGVILLPQAIAFAIIAELPPVMGLYAAIIGGIVGGIWGSSHQAHTGPTNAMSLLVLSSLTTVYASGSPELIVAAGMLAVMVGLFQLLLAVLRLGMLVNFVSHSVIVGFASGAGLLIVIKQLETLLGLSIGAEHISETLWGVVLGLPESHHATAVIGIGVIVLMAVLRRINRKLPAALISMLISSLIVFILDLENQGVAVIGRLPSGLPPLADLPLLDFELIASLLPGTLAVAAIGLVETLAIGRSIATQTNQRLDSNQEFFGQGMANLMAGLFSGYPVAGSFSRSAVNFEAGARTPVAAIVSSVCVVLAMFLLAPLAAYLPRTALSGVLVVTGFTMIDRAEIRRILTGTRGDALIMLITFFGTLFLHIEVAVLMGIMFSLVMYLIRTSTPRVHHVVPDDSFRHFIYDPDRPVCPQLGTIDVLGDLYFGAVNHVEEVIHRHQQVNPRQRFILMRMNNVNNCDFSGIHMLESVVRSYRERGGDVFMVRIRPRVERVMRTTGFWGFLGEQNVLSEDKAIAHLFYKILDPAVCIYECKHRVFLECQNLPKRDFFPELPLDREVPDSGVAVVSAKDLWQRMRAADGGKKPRVIDVREPREFRQGHVPGSELVPLQSLLVESDGLPITDEIIFVCRSGRRSQRAAKLLMSRGCRDVKMLDGGILSWEAAKLLEAVEQ